MIKLVAAALLAILAGYLVVTTVPPSQAAMAAPATPSFDIAMPPPQAPFDTTPITAVETVGASPTE